MPRSPTTTPATGRSGSAKEIKVDLHVVRRIGDRLMPAIADAYLSAVKHAEHAVDSGAWQRGERIGLAPRGAYGGWKKLHAELLRLLRDTRHEIMRAGNHLMIAGRLVDQSDEEVRAQLKEHRDRGTQQVMEQSGGVSYGSGLQGAVAPGSPAAGQAPHDTPVSGGTAPR